MKKRPKLRLGWALAGALLLFVLVIGPERRKAGAWKIKALTRSRFYYPTNDVFLAVDGKHYPALEEHLKKEIFLIHNRVLIDVGHVSTEFSGVMPFQYLSPLIRRYPKASYFRMTWEVPEAKHTSDFELIYDRDKGEVTETRIDHPTRGAPYTVMLGKYLTDRDIHNAGLDAVKNRTDFQVWATKYWNH